MHILYVEDDDDLRDGFTELLDDGARHVVSCADAKQALERFAAHPFDVVITDVALPGQSGVELARTLLANRPGLPIFLCSGFDMHREAQKLGPSVQALIKPFDFEVLERLLNDLSAALDSAEPGTNETLGSDGKSKTEG